MTYPATSMIFSKGPRLLQTSADGWLSGLGMNKAG